MTVENIQQYRFYQHFVEMSAIPRESGNEKAVSDYLVAFGDRLGLPVWQDEANNVVITKPGTAGLEGAEPVLLQAHIDMVCEKTPESRHNFLTDPILPRIRDGYLMADGTTLGADNGIGAAYMMAVLEDDSIAHPPIEAVFTTSEEVGMNGMQALDAGRLRAGRMLNLDSEGEGVLFASCAGGVRFILELPVVTEQPAQGSVPYRVAVYGLTGGHSGVDINKERANAILFLGRLLSGLRSRFAIQVSEMGGGSKDNAIPREAAAVLWLPADAAAEAVREVERLSAVITAEYTATEPGLRILFEPVSAAQGVLDEDSLQVVLAAILLVPNGAFHYNPHLPGVLDASSNLGILHQSGENVVLTGLIRSNTNSRVQEGVERVGYLAAVLGAELNTGSSYPAWEYREQSALRDRCRQVFRERYGAEMEVASIHGGLECALMAGKRPDMDMVSIGPNLDDVHTPQERAEIASLIRVWEYLVALLAKL